MKSLAPGCFAAIMATGIVSNAFYFEGRHDISNALFSVNLVAYACLVAATLARLACYFRSLLDDLFNPHQVFAFFTIVAGTGVLGVGFHLRGYEFAALAMWVLALIIWLSLIYLSFGVLTFLNTERGTTIVDGGWLIAIVGPPFLC